MSPVSANEALSLFSSSGSSRYLDTCILQSLPGAVPLLILHVNSSCIWLVDRTPLMHASGSRRRSGSGHFERDVLLKRNYNILYDGSDSDLVDELHHIPQVGGSLYSLTTCRRRIVRIHEF